MGRGPSAAMQYRMDSSAYMDDSWIEWSFVAVIYRKRDIYRLVSKDWLQTHHL